MPGSSGRTSLNPFTSISEIDGRLLFAFINGEYNYESKIDFVKKETSFSGCL